MFLKPMRPALLWAAFILIICAVPGENLPRLDFFAWLRPDKLVHLFIFGTLCFLLVKGFMKQEAFHLLRASPKSVAVLSSIAYGIVIELLQEYFFSGRTGDVRDVIADAIGAFAGLWCYNYFLKKKFPGHSS